jgi:2-methylisocitrate lyase-like PEP mutase family enzyme
LAIPQSNNGIAIVREKDFARLNPDVTLASTHNRTEKTMSDATTVFRKLHEDPAGPLRLANVWDAGSARLVESLGARAVATTSAGVGWALGYPDGNLLPVKQLENLVSNIVRIVRVPVSVDVEAGYSDDPKKVGENLKAVLGSGIAGINIEDGTDPVDLLVAKIETIKRVAVSLGVDIFVNARTDVYLQGLFPEEKRMEETVTRAARYRSAGADGIFVPALSDPKQIKEIVPAVKLPVNLMAWPGLPNAAELKQLGVRRLSSGSGIPQILWNHVAWLAKEFLETGASEPMSVDYMAHGELQGLFAVNR